MTVGDLGARGSAFTVTVFYAPSPWLKSLDEVTEIPVKCMGAKTYLVFRLALATPQGQLPDAYRRLALVSAKERARQSAAFRVALRVAVAAHVGCKVGLIGSELIDWGDGVA